MEAISRHQKRMDFSFFSILQGAFEHQHLLQQAARPAKRAPYAPAAAGAQNNTTKLKQGNERTKQSFL